MAARCAYSRSAVGSHSWKDEMFFIDASCVKENTGDGDGMGELREEEIIWGETLAGGNSNGELGPQDLATASGRGRHGSCYRSNLSIEMQNSEEFRNGDPSCGIMNLRTSRSEPSMMLYNGRHSRTAASKYSDMEIKYHSDEEEDDDDDDDEQNLTITPPHELMARQYSSTPTFSVLHGAGRTLKGMDLRRLRNEVLRQTGFID